MSIRTTASGLLAFVLMAALLVFAPAASAASAPCADLPDRKVMKIIKRHGFVLKGWTSKSTTKVCWMVRRADGRRANVDMLIEKHPENESLGPSFVRRQFWNVKRVSRYHNVDKMKVVVQIYAGKGGAKTNPMNFIGRLRFALE